MLDRLVWADINLSNYSHNIRSIKELIGPKVKLMAVVKANAYGHGAVEIAKFAEKLPVDYLGVVCLYEGKQLFEAGIKVPILILNYIDLDGAKAALDLNLSLNVMDEALLKSLNNYARKSRKQAKIHVKIDSGMHRAGIRPDKAIKFIQNIENYKNIYLEGVFTHFATSDEKDLGFTRQQLTIFNHTLAKLRTLGIKLPLIHAANSGATLRLKQSYFNMVRPGIITYGLSPTGLAPADEFKLTFKSKPVLTLKTKLVQIRRIGTGESVGYGRKFIASQETVVGLIPVGYADGFRRAPNNWGFVLVNGKKAPLLGRVSMDQSSIDLTKIPYAKIGEEVILIGNQGNQSITAEDVAVRLGTINYEVVSSLASRVSRVYMNH